MGRVKIYAVIDTNVLISALIAKTNQTPPLIVLSHIYVGTIIPVFNKEIFEEYSNVLGREKFHLNPTDIEEALNIFLKYGICIDKIQSADFEFIDNSDAIFYEVKMSIDKTYLVTGNIKHFPLEPFVVTPREMVQIIERLKDCYE